MSSLATDFWDARRLGNKIDVNTFPESQEAAYQLQASLNDASGCTVNGFKIGATSITTMEMLGLDQPFYGPLYQEFTRHQGGEIPVHVAHGPQVETEFVVAIGKDLSGNGNRTLNDIRAVTSWVSGGFEIIGSRLKTVPEKRGLCAIADFGANLDFMVGDPVRNWQEFNLDDHPVDLYVNDKQVANGNSNLSIAGNPLGMVAWLLNHPRFQSRGLLDGDLISCGTCTGIYPVAPGDTLRAEFGALGTLTANITAADTSA